MRRPGSVDLILGATVLIWAFNVTVTKYVLTHGFQPLAYGAIRYGAAAVLAVVVALALERSLAVGGRRSLMLIGLAAAFLLVNQVSFVYALKLELGDDRRADHGHDADLHGDRRVDRRARAADTGFWVATAVGFAGVAMVAVGSGGDLSADLGGDLLALSLVGLVGLLLGVDRAAHAPLLAVPDQRGRALRDVRSVPGDQLAPARRPGLRLASNLVWVCLAFAIVGPLFLTNILWFTAVHRVGPSRATLFANVQPFVAAIFAAVILSEHLSWIQWLGGATILAGIVLERRLRRAPLETVA